MKTYTPWKQQDSRIIVASDRTFRAPEKWEGRVKIECDLFERFAGLVADIDGNVLSDRMTKASNADLHNGEILTIDDLRRRVFEVIDNSQATFLAVTKEPGRVRELWPDRPGMHYYCEEPGFDEEAGEYTEGVHRCNPCRPNLHLFAECHNQATVDERVPELLKCRDLSPSIGIWFRGLSEEVDLWGARFQLPTGGLGSAFSWGEGIDTIVIEGTDQPLNPNHVRSLRDQCEAAGVRPVFLGWGDHIPFNQITNDEQRELWSKAVMAGKQSYFGCRIAVGPQGLKTSTTPGIEPVSYAEIGRAASGRLLDGREWGWE